MSDDRRGIIATICVCAQVGIDEFRDYRTSKVFYIKTSIGDILEWAKKSGLKEPHINDIVFSESDDT